MKYVSLNPEYVLKNDSGRVLIMTQDPLRAIEPVVESTIHPIHAMILSFFTGRISYSEAITAAAHTLSIERKLIEFFCNKILENDKNIGVQIDRENILVFPRRTLIISDHPISRQIYDYKNFEYRYLNLRTERHITPSRITFMVTTKCLTDCIYCYANRKHPNCSLLPFERVEAIIREAKELGVVSFDVIGGEFFKYPQWKPMLKMLYQYGYNPYISTKVPLGEDDIKFLKDVGVKDIQISLDTLLPHNIRKLLNVREDYISKIKIAINNLEKYGIGIQIHTILTSYNKSIQDMESLNSFLINKKNIISWKIDYASSPIYEKRPNYSTVKIDRISLNNIYMYFERVKDKKPNFRIISGNLNLKENPNPHELNPEDKNNYFSKKRPIFCAANFSSLFILPDGKVTICEELYWNKTFLVGDLNEQGLLDIWTSKKAMDLFYIKKSSISDNSPCKTCNIFKECREEYGGVCWKEIIKVYGDEHWDFPDPRCPKAGMIDARNYV